MNPLLLIGLGAVALFAFGRKKREHEWIDHPAQTYCTNQGGTIRIITHDDGGQDGLCILPTGHEIMEWDFFRNELVAFSGVALKTSDVVPDGPEQIEWTIQRDGAGNEGVWSYQAKATEGFFVEAADYSKEWTFDAAWSNLVADLNGMGYEPVLT